MCHGVGADGVDEIRDTGQERSTALRTDAARASMGRVAAAYSIRQAESRPQAGPTSRSGTRRTRRADGVVDRAAGGRASAVDVAGAAGVADGSGVQLPQRGVGMDEVPTACQTSLDQSRGGVSINGTGDGSNGGRGRRKRGRASQATGIVWTRTAMQKFDSEVDHG